MPLLPASVFDPTQVEGAQSQLDIQHFGAVVVIQPSYDFRVLSPETTLDPLDKNQFRVTHVSSNVAEVLGHPIDLLAGQAWSRIMAVEDIRCILLALRGAHQRGQIYAHHSISATARCLTTVTHLTRCGRIVVDVLPELVAALGPQDAAAAFSYLESCDNIYRDANTAVHQLSQLLKFDRVMIYRCTASQPGEVIAEARIAPTMHPFLGCVQGAAPNALPPALLHDWLQRGIRCVVDGGIVKNNKVVEVQPSAPVDLKQSFLYPVAVPFLQQLRNFHVRVVALCPIVVDNDSLWGFITLYHHSERPQVTWNERALLTLVAGRIATAAVHEKRATNEKQHTQLVEMTAQLEDRMAEQLPPTVGKAGILHQLMCGHPDLCEMTGCQSFAFRCDQTWLRVGACPPVTWLRTFSSWAVQQPGCQAGEVHTFAPADLTFDVKLSSLHVSADERTAQQMDSYLCGFISVDPIVAIVCFQFDDDTHPNPVSDADIDSVSAAAAAVSPSDGSVYQAGDAHPRHSPPGASKRKLTWPVNAAAMLAVVTHRLGHFLEQNSGDLRFLLDEVGVLLRETAQPQIQLSSLLLREYMDGILVVLRATPASASTSTTSHEQMPSDGRRMDKILCVNQGYIQVLGFPGETADCDDGDIERTLQTSGIPVASVIDPVHNTQRCVEVWSKDKGLRTLQMYYRHVLNIHHGDVHQEILCLSFYDVTHHVRTMQTLDISQRASAEVADTKQQLVGMVSHELRTPLHAILGFSSLLETEFCRQLQEYPRMAEYIQDIHHAGTHLLAIVTNLLDLSKMEQVSEQPVRVSSVLQDVCHWVRAAIAAKSLRLVLRVPEAHEPHFQMHVRSDPVALRRICLNLLDNAIKFTPAGGRIEVSLVWIPPSLLSSAPAGSVQLRIQDTGVGMKPDVLPRIFTMFYQADTTIQRDHGGIGLGLAMVTRLVESLRGHITVESTWGVGSTFICTLPLAVLATGELTSSPSEMHRSVKRSPSPQPSMKRKLLPGDSDAGSSRPPAPMMTAHTSTAASALSFPAMEPSDSPDERGLLAPTHLASATRDVMPDADTSPKLPLHTVAAVQGSPPFTKEDLGAASPSEKPLAVALVSLLPLVAPLPLPVILIVDDSEINLKLCRRMLQQEGYTQFESAANGLLALERMILLRAAGRTPRCMFLDLHMPSMDGFEACRCLRELGFTLPICALTAAIGSDTQERCTAGGFSHVLFKPVHRTQLRATLRLMLP